jgi:hypothetical protein
MQSASAVRPVSGNKERKADKSNYLRGTALAVDFGMLRTAGVARGGMVFYVVTRVNAVDEVAGRAAPTVTLAGEPAAAQGGLGGGANVRCGVAVPLAAQPGRR